MPPPWWSWLILAGIIAIYVAVSTADAGMGLSGGTVLFVWNQPHWVEAHNECLNAVSIDSVYAVVEKNKYIQLLDKHDMIIAQFPVKDWAIVNKGKM
jgi:hypothetical protein